MAAGRYSLSSVNPNNAIGGGGCACSELAHPDQEGPFVIFPCTEMDNNLSPHNVVCIGCMAGALDLGLNGELLSSGEDDPANAPEELSL